MQGCFLFSFLFGPIVPSQLPERLTAFLGQLEQNCSSEVIAHLQCVDSFYNQE